MKDPCLELSGIVAGRTADDEGVGEMLRDDEEEDGDLISPLRRQKSSSLRASVRCHTIPEEEGAEHEENHPGAASGGGESTQRPPRRQKHLLNIRQVMRTLC